MKYFLLVVAMSLSLVGCSEKKQENITSSDPMIAPPASMDRSFVKATLERPSVIPPVVLEAESGCQVDWINDKPAQQVTSITEKEKVGFVGWAGNLETGTTSPEVFIVLNGPSKVYLKAFPGLQRPDIVLGIKKPGLSNSGWEAFADLSGVSAGTYKMQVIQVKGPSVSVCDTERSLVIN